MVLLMSRFLIHNIVKWLLVRQDLSDRLGSIREHVLQKSERDG